MPGPKAVLEQLFLLSAKPDHYVRLELKCADLSSRKICMQGNWPSSAVLQNRQISRLGLEGSHVTSSVRPFQQDSIGKALIPKPGL